MAKKKMVAIFAVQAFDDVAEKTVEYPAGAEFDIEENEAEGLIAQGAARYHAGAKKEAEMADSTSDGTTDGTGAGNTAEQEGRRSGVQAKTGTVAKTNAPATKAK